MSCLRLVLTAVLVLGLCCLVPVPASAETIRYWTTEEQPARLAIQEAVAAKFKSKTGIDVTVIPVNENELPKRATAAFAAGDLPDVIFMPLQHVLPWAEEGLLDVEASNEVVIALGTDTFAAGVLSMANTKDGFAAVPFSAWPWMTIYRLGTFKKMGLAKPVDFNSIAAAARALHDPPKRYGFCVATKIDDGFMSQTMEALFLANGVDPVKADGTVHFDPKASKEVLEFYKTLFDVSPKGELYWKQSRETYFNGTTELIFWSPFILDEMAGLRDSAPPAINDDPTSRALAKDSGVLTTLSGPSNPKGSLWVEVVFLGITADANTDAAMAFAKFAMSEGYMEMLTMAPEGNFPVRNGPTAGSTEYVSGWAGLPVGVDRKAPLGEIYGDQLILDMVSGLQKGTRWGVAVGQLSKASKIVNSQIVNRLVRQFVEGELDAEATIDKLNKELAKID